MARSIPECTSSTTSRARRRVDVRVPRMQRPRENGRRAMGPSPPTDRAVSLEEAVSIAIRLQQNDQWVAARDVYRRILEIAPDYPEALHFSGVLAHQEGNSEQAIVLIERSLELEPDRADWHSNLAIVLRDRL